MQKRCIIRAARQAHYIPVRKCEIVRARISDNGRLHKHRWGIFDVHTHLKGRIFSAEGVSYLVLSDDSNEPECLRVKALNAARSVYDMRCEEVERHLSQPSRKKT